MYLYQTHILYPFQQIPDILKNKIQKQSTKQDDLFTKFRIKFRLVHEGRYDKIEHRCHRALSEVCHLGLTPPVR